MKLCLRATSTKRCIWNPDRFDNIEVQEFLNKLKTEQLQRSQPGDYLWDTRSDSHDILEDISLKPDRSPSTSRVATLAENKKVKFVCVVTNLRSTIEKSTGEKLTDDTTELIVFDGQKVTNIFS